MSSDLLGVPEAAQELKVSPARVRELLAHGALPGEKLAGRWLLRRADVHARRGDPTPPGRPLTPANAWLLLLEASQEPQPKPADPMAHWRMRRALRYPGLAAMRPRLQSRAHTHHLWALDAELRRLRDTPGVVLSGSSAATALNLDLAAPDTLDAYIPAADLQALIAEHALQAAEPAQANVTLRAVPDDAWSLHARHYAPAAAVALDLALYPDARSARAGMGLLNNLDRQHHQA
jgi:excisionase family DNA binding protein